MSDMTPDRAVGAALAATAAAARACEEAALVLRAAGREPDPNYSTAVGHLELAAVELAAMGRRVLGHSVRPPVP
jgi:hypothetical protein